MTASTVKGENATNFTADPRVPLNRKGGNLKVRQDTIEVATTSIDEVGDIMLLLPIPTNAIVTSLQLLNDDLDSNGTPTLDANIGVYYTGTGPQRGTYTEGQKADDNLFADDSNELQAANVTPVELNTVLDNIDDVDKPLWERAGLSADPGGHFFIGIEVGSNAAATAAAGGIRMIAHYY